MAGVFEVSFSFNSDLSIRKLLYFRAISSVLDVQFNNIIVLYIHVAGALIRVYLYLLTGRQF